MLLPCGLKTRISTASSATNMRLSAWESLTSGWVSFQSATLGQFCIGGNKGKVTRRERFLAEMDGVIPWPRLVKLIEPHYPKAGQGRQPLGLEKMLRIYFLQQWFNLSDPQAEDAIYDSESMRRFARVELGEEVVPDETTILRFRHLLEKHELTQAIFNSITGLLEERRLLLRSGTIVDATIIAAPSSTKNARATRDPEMKQTRKGRNWHFGMKLHTEQTSAISSIR